MVPPADGIALNHLTLISNGENWNLIMTFNSKNTPPPPPPPSLDQTGLLRSGSSRTAGYGHVKQQPLTELC